MKDIPYSRLKEDKRAYDIMILRDQRGSAFSDIAKDYETSPVRTKEIYSRIKMRQIRLYIRHISIALGHENTAKVRKVFEAAYECYHSFPCACAYLEKKYKNILEEYRAGEPGTSKQMIKALPPLKRKFSEEMISRVVEMREAEKAAFTAIGKELDITPEKAKGIYNRFYSQKVLNYVEALQKEAKSQEERWAVWNRYFGNSLSPKKRYEKILAERENQEG